MAILASPLDSIPEQLFLGHIKLIDKITAQAARRARFKLEEAEDFASLVKIKLISDNYAVIRKFQGKSNFKTYLIVVIQRLRLDYQISLWGKHHVSAETQRLGPVAMRMERLLREGHTFDETCEILRTNEKMEMSIAELTDIRVKLPPRTSRHNVGEERLMFESAPDLRPDERVEEMERDVIRRRVYTALQQALETLSKEDRLLVKLRQEYSVAQIARLWCVEQKPLYRRLDKIHKELRKAILHKGIQRQDIEEVLGI